MQDISVREKALFDRVADRANLSTTQTIDSYEQILLGLAGFAAGNQSITSIEWGNYVSTIQRQETQPTVRDFGLLDTDFPSLTTTTSRFVTMATGETFQDSKHNLIADPIMGPAIKQAMSSDRVSLSAVVRGRFGLNDKVGYALVAPVMPLNTETKLNRSAVFVSFTADGLLASAQRNIAIAVCLELYDGLTTTVDTLVHQYCPSDVTPDDRYYDDKRAINIGERTFTLSLSSKRGFYVAPLALPVGVIVPLGLIITALLGALLWFEATTREQAKSLAQTMTSDLETSRNRYDRVVRVAGVGFWERDYRSNQIIWSEQMWALAGLDPNTHLTGDSKYNIEMIVHPEDQERIKTALSAHIKLDQPYSEEFRFLRPDNSIIWIYSTANTDRDEKGNPIRTIGSVTDITPRKKEEERRRAKENELTDTISELTRSQKKLDAALRDAEAASRAKSTFLSTMSHELRTPLNAILGFSEVIRDNLLGRESARSYKDYAGDIHSSGEHLLDLINDILDLAKVEEGQITLSPEELILNTVIENTINLMQPRAIAKQHSLTMALPEESISVHADLRALKQILFNLISNAIQFTEPGGEIEVSAIELDNDTVEICVSDTGIGIAQADIGRIFNPFERVTEPGKPESEGTGLGLAVVKSLVELQNGSLGVESTPGKGSTFCVSLPVS